MYVHEDGSLARVDRVVRKDGAWLTTVAELRFLTGGRIRLSLRYGVGPR